MRFLPLCQPRTGVLVYPSWLILLFQCTIQHILNLIDCRLASDEETDYLSQYSLVALCIDSGKDRKDVTRAALTGSYFIYDIKRGKTMK